MKELNTTELIWQKARRASVRVATAMATAAAVLSFFMPATLSAQELMHASNEFPDAQAATSTAQPSTTTYGTAAPRRTVAALRTNLLLPALNIGAELPIGRHWSVGADYYYPWLWRKSDNKNCFQLAFVSGEMRYWFGKRYAAGSSDAGRKLLGHSIAAYGAWGYYDIEHNWSGHQGNLASGGIDYLYAAPIAKGRMHIELQLAVGYIHSKAQPYDVFDNGGNLIRRKDVYKNFDYIGPTKAAVSLVLPLTKKGGSR